jgi:hypothetical protein
VADERGSAVVTNLLSGAAGAVVVFLLTYFLIAVPAEHTSERTVREARQRASIEAVKKDVAADIGIAVHDPHLAPSARLLIARASHLYQEGDSTFDSGADEYSAALGEYNAALGAARRAIESQGTAFVTALRASLRPRARELPRTP